MLLKPIGAAIESGNKIAIEFCSWLATSCFTFYWFICLFFFALWDNRNSFISMQCQTMMTLTMCSRLLHDNIELNTQCNIPIHRQRHKRFKLDSISAHYHFIVLFLFCFVVSLSYCYLRHFVCFVCFVSFFFILIRWDNKRWWHRGIWVTWRFGESQFVKWIKTGNVGEISNGQECGG